MAVDAGLAVAGVGGLGRLVAQGTLVALAALAAVGEGVEGQAQPVHAPAGTRCRQALLAWHGTTHSPPAPARRQHQRSIAPGPATALVRHSHGGTALPQHWHGTTGTAQPWHDSALVAWHGAATAWHHRGTEMPWGGTGTALPWHHHSMVLAWSHHVTARYHHDHGMVLHGTTRTSAWHRHGMVLAWHHHVTAQHRHDTGHGMAPPAPPSSRGGWRAANGMGGQGKRCGGTANGLGSDERGSQ